MAKALWHLPYRQRFFPVYRPRRESTSPRRNRARSRPEPRKASRRSVPFSAFARRSQRPSTHPDSLANSLCGGRGHLGFVSGVCRSLDAVGCSPGRCHYRVCDLVPFSGCIVYRTVTHGFSLFTSVVKFLPQGHAWKCLDRVHVDPPSLGSRVSLVINQLNPYDLIFSVRSPGTSDANACAKTAAVQREPHHSERCRGKLAKLHPPARKSRDRWRHATSPEFRRPPCKA
jgi:hypothetical protein